MALKERLKSAFVASAVAVTGMIASPAYAADLTCHTTPQAIEGAKTQIVKSEGMIPVTSHFRNVGTDAKASWAMATVMMNPSSKKGYEWVKTEDGMVCVAKSYSNIELMSNVSLSPKALLDLKSYPRANDRGDGKDISSTGINIMLAFHSTRGKNPMYRATIDNAIDVTGKATKTSGNIEFLVSNPTTKEGVLLTSSPNGKDLGAFTRYAGVPQKDGVSVKFGTIYSPAAEDMLGLSVAMLPPDVTRPVLVAANGTSPR